MRVGGGRGEGGVRVMVCMRVARARFVLSLARTQPHTIPHPPSAPEAQRGGRLSPMSDVYSLGITLWEL